MKQGKTHIENKVPLAGKGSGVTRRDSQYATGTPKGGGTKRIDKTKGGHLSRSTGSFKGYR